MSFFKNLSEKAMTTAQAIGTKSQEMVEVGKLKLQISQVEGEIKKLKFEIGELIYDAYSKSQESPNELIEKINSDISAKLIEIEDLKVKIQAVQVKEEEEKHPVDIPMTEDEQQPEEQPQQQEPPKYPPSNNENQL